MNYDCPICLENMKDKIVITLPCQNISHSMCMKCFIHMRNKLCPICRTSFENIIPDIDSSTRFNLLEFLQSSE